jgi:hypothetical protein
MQMLDLEKEVRVDIERYKKMIEMYSSGIRVLASSAPEALSPTIQKK